MSLLSIIRRDSVQYSSGNSHAIVLIVHAWMKNHTQVAERDIEKRVKWCDDGRPQHSPEDRQSLNISSVPICSRFRPICACATETQTYCTEVLLPSWRVAVTMNRVGWFRERRQERVTEYYNRVPRGGFTSTLFRVEILIWDMLAWCNRRWIFLFVFLLLV